MGLLLRLSDSKSKEVALRYSKNLKRPLLIISSRISNPLSCLTLNNYNQHNLQANVLYLLLSLLKPMKPSKPLVTRVSTQLLTR